MDPQRTTLVAILDELIPPNDSGNILGAGASGVAEFLPTADAYAPDPLGAIQTIITAVGEDFANLSRDEKVICLKRVEAERPDAFATLVRLTYMGYYSRPETRPYFGVGAHPVHPKGYPVALDSEVMMEELTAPVRARGKVYRCAE